MWRNEECPKCQSTEIIPNVRILDRMSAADFDATDLTTVVYDNPGALVFKGKHLGFLNAQICGQCGYTELFVSNPEELLAAYKKAQARRQP